MTGNRETAGRQDPGGGGARVWRLVLVDDHPVIREGLRRLISDWREFEVVGEAPDGEAAVQLVREHRPDVVLMDLRLPGINGIETTRRIVAEQPGVHVVGLSVHDDEAAAAVMRRAGAAAYLVKGCSPDALRAALHVPDEADQA